jgi:hypothetical protein
MNAHDTVGPGDGMGDDAKGMLRAGTVKRIHVDQLVIRRCRNGGCDDPALTVQTSKGPVKARRVEIHGRAVLVQRLDRPLKCGARVWIETRARVTAE